VGISTRSGDSNRTLRNLQRERGNRPETFTTTNGKEGNKWAGQGRKAPGLVGRMRVQRNRAALRNIAHLGRAGERRLLSLRERVLSGLKGVPSWAPPTTFLPQAPAAPPGPDSTALQALWNSLTTEQRAVLEQNPTVHRG
jgi:hypothetical protein